MRAATTPPGPDDLAFAERYLNTFYVDEGGGFARGAAPPSMVRAIVRFQAQTGRPATGVLSAADVAVMKVAPRCGVPDTLRLSAAAESDRWASRDLTYFVESTVAGLSRADALRLTQQAWDQWSEVANVRARVTADATTADVILTTARGASAGFDGPYGVLAWAYLPTGDAFQGQLSCRFDLDETWSTVGSSLGIAYLNVACHEFGHLLGLPHSTNPKALMAPYYSPAVATPQAVDDVPRIRLLYGAAPPLPPVDPVKPPVDPVKPVAPAVTLEQAIAWAKIGIQKDGRYPFNASARAQTAAERGLRTNWPK